MVLLLPIHDGEYLKTCTRCSHLGLASPVLQRSSFYMCRKPTSERGPRFISYCRKCNTIKCNEYQRETGVAREYNRRRRERARQDPVAWEQYLERERRYQKTYRDNNRERVRAANRERKRWLRDEVAEVAKTVTSGIALPIEPFRGWIIELMEKERQVGNGTEAEKRIAFRLGVSTRRVRSYLYEWDAVDEAVVDRCCSREGSVMIWELYPSQLEYLTA